MPLERRATTLYSRQTLSRLHRLAAWGLGCSSKGQCSEDTTQGRGCGEESQIPSKSMLLKRRYNSLPNGPAATGHPRQNGPRPKPRVLGPVNRSLWFLRWNGPAPTGRTARRSRSADRKRRHGAHKRQDSPRHHSSRRDSGRREDERSRPSSSGGSSSRRRAESSSVSKASDTRPSASSSHHRHHQSSGDQRSLSPASSRAFPDRKSPPSHHERRQESADRTGHSYVARREVQLSPKIVKPPEKRTITVISSPARKVHLESAPEVQVPAPVMDGAAGDGPATGDGSTTGDGPATGNGPATGDGPATVDDPADVSVVESSHSWALQFDDPVESDGPARHPVDGSAGHGTPAATTAGGGPDVSMLTGTSSPLFPSIPRSINQATLVDFMSMWTLLQRQMDQASVPDTPAVQSSLPAPRHDSTLRRSATPARTPERRPRTPQRFTRTPVRQVRTPVRRARSCSESRESRSRSPVSRSSSVESSTRDGSPVNFTPALDPDAKRSISDEEDDEGDSKKISAAQYQIFRQAVTTSKGLFKVNPAKTKRASRASLLDLGDPEVTDRVSWFDQPSLQDTMVSTARIAQGLKDDEEVEKTTLSETLNTASSTFKFFTVKQMFPREPYRLKIHRDALYVPKPPGDHGFSDNKAPSSYQVSDVFRHGRVGPEVSHLRLSSGLYGGSGDRRTLSQGWTL